MSKLSKIILSGLSAVFSVIFTVVFIRTLTIGVDQELQLARWEKTVNISAVLDEHQREQLLANFKEAVRIPTVSSSANDINTTALLEFNRFLRRVFPTVFSSSLVRHELVHNYSHLFRVQGSQPDLEPYLLMAHIDVVPASESDGWEAPPFSAKEMDGFIYGRGTLDNKCSVMGVLQALEYLLIKGYKPRRGFYISLGHDEEIQGLNGALNIVRVLKERDAHFAFILDEGLAIVDGIIPGLGQPVALVGVTEKGYATLKLSVSMSSGHSSMPPSETSIGVLAKAVKRLEDNPLPNLFGHGPERKIFEDLAREFSFPMRIVASNLWLFGPLLSKILETKPNTNAVVRTTTAVTMFNAGVKINVIPSVAEAYVNLRIHSSQTLREVLLLHQATIADPRVKIDLLSGFEPLPVSSTDETAFGYQVIRKTLSDQFPTMPVTRGACIANTDSRHFRDLTDNIYRFVPLSLKPDDSTRIHGLNERISKKNYEEIVQFFFNFIQNGDIQKLPEPHSSSHEL